MSGLSNYLQRVFIQSKAGSPEFFHHRIRGIPKSSHTFPPHKNPPSMMARWRAKWVLGMLWKITENPMAKAFRKVMSVWGCLMVDGLSCSSGFQFESSREQKVFAGDGKSLSPFFCLYWPPARNLISIRWNKLIVEGANVWTNTFEQPVRDFDVLVCTKRLCHLFSWSLCEVEIHRTYTDSLATSMWL